jgi:hypothetical protein
MRNAEIEISGCVHGKCVGTPAMRGKECGILLLGRIFLRAKKQHVFQVMGQAGKLLRIAQGSFKIISHEEQY